LKNGFFVQALTSNANETHKTHRKAAMYAILGDLLFIVLPLVVISIVDVSVGRSLFAIIESPELSFGSAVLFGQTIIKVVSGFAHNTLWSRATCLYYRADYCVWFSPFTGSVSVTTEC